jgi:hypothetical protein
MLGKKKIQLDNGTELDLSKIHYADLEAMIKDIGELSVDVDGDAQLGFAASSRVNSDHKLARLAGLLYLILLPTTGLWYGTGGLSWRATRRPRSPKSRLADPYLSLRSSRVRPALSIT